VLRPRLRRIDRMVSLFLLPGCHERNCRSGCDYRRPQRSAEPEGTITRHAVARGGAPEQAATTFRDVFAVAEFRALWAAQLLSVIGDQLARVALTVLVYDRTRSALLAAVTFVASIVPTFVGGVMLAWLADRYPRRRVMIACDVVRCALVLVMAIPGVPLAGLVTLLFLVTLVSAPFTSARAAIYPDVLAGDRYVMGVAVTLPDPPKPLMHVYEDTWLWLMRFCPPDSTIPAECASVRLVAIVLCPIVSLDAAIVLVS